MSHSQVHSTLRPDEFETVQRVFKEISAESWFSRDPEAAQKFGAFVIRAYQIGISDFTHLHDLALRTARQRFANDNTSQ